MIYRVLPLPPPPPPPPRQSLAPPFPFVLSCLSPRASLPTQSRHLFTCLHPSPPSPPPPPVITAELCVPPVPLPRCSRCNRWSRTAAFTAGSIVGLGKELGDYLGWWLGRVSARDLVADYLGIAAGIALVETWNARNKSQLKPSFFSTPASTAPRSVSGDELV